MSYIGLIYRYPHIIYKRFAVGRSGQKVLCTQDCDPDPQHCCSGPQTCRLGPQACCHGPQTCCLGPQSSCWATELLFCSTNQQLFWLTSSSSRSLAAIWQLFLAHQQLFWLTGSCVLAHRQLCWLTGTYLAAVPGSQQEQEPAQQPGRQNNCWRAKTAAGEPERSS